MRARFPVFVETTPATELVVDAFLERNGSLVPLSLKFDPHEVRGSEAPSEPPHLLSDSNAALIAKIDRIEGAIAPVLAVHRRVAPIHARIASVGESLDVLDRVFRARTIAFDEGNAESTKEPSE